MIKALSLVALISISGLASTACSTAPKTTEDRSELRQEAAQTVAQAKAQDAGVAKTLNSAAGYAVFPKIGKAAAGVGGAYGKGVLYQNGKVVGYCDVTQATVGLQLGGQSYAEIIAFEDAKAVQHFKDEEVTFDAQATAVAVESGTGTNAKYHNGVQIFTLDEKGLMAEASVGGQRFSYKAL